LLKLTFALYSVSRATPPAETPVSSALFTRAANGQIGVFQTSEARTPHQRRNTRTASNAYKRNRSNLQLAQSMGLAMEVRFRGAEAVWHLLCGNLPQA
jgi:hypothetical protein